MAKAHVASITPASEGEPVRPLDLQVRVRAKDLLSGLHNPNRPTVAEIAQGRNQEMAQTVPMAGIDVSEHLP
jgi:hypothetical protein